MNLSAPFCCGYGKLMLQVQLCVLFLTGFCSMGVTAIQRMKFRKPPVTVEIPEKQKLPGPPPPIQGTLMKDLVKEWMHVSL